MEPLIEIPLGKWPEFQELYKSNWPYGVVGYCLLSTQVNYPGLIHAFSFKVYCPEGDMNNGMIATISRKDIFQLLIYPVHNDLTKIEEALKTTKLINWQNDILIPSANLDVIQCLERIKDRVGVRIFYDDQTKAFKHILKRNTKLFENLSCPLNTYVGPLKPEHIDLIDKTWTYHSKNSFSFFKTLIENNLTYVLYSADDHKPLAWVAINESSALTHLYCLEPHRKKGYAEFITKIAANDMLKQDLDVLAYTIEDNFKPQNLFDKIGFERIGYDYWVFVQKKR